MEEHKVSEQNNIERDISEKMIIDDLIDKIENAKTIDLNDTSNFKHELTYSLENCINNLRLRINNKNSLDFRTLNRRKAKLDIMINSDDSYFSELEIKARDVCYYIVNNHIILIFSLFYMKFI